MGDSSFVVVVDGLEERLPGGAKRAQYCIQLVAGTELHLREQAGIIHVLHGGFVIGQLSAADRRIGNALATGSAPRCVVQSIEIAGWIWKTARRLEIRITPAEESTLTAVARVLSGGFAVPETISSFAAATVRFAGDQVGSISSSAQQAASNVGEWVVDQAVPAIDVATATVSFAGAQVGSLSSSVQRGASVVGDVLVNQAAPAIGHIATAPARGLRSLVRGVWRKATTVYFAVVALLILVLAIVMVWRLPSLLGIASSQYIMQQPTVRP